MSYPNPLPKWYAVWAKWREGGALPPRPASLPRRIPAWCWLKFKTDHPPKRRSSLVWDGVGLIANCQNIGGSTIAQEYPNVRNACIEIFDSPDLVPKYDDYALTATIADYSKHELKVTGWGFCWGVPDPYTEGTAHAKLAKRLGLDGFMPNFEEPYDCHGDWTNPKLVMTRQYFDGFRYTLPLPYPMAAVTTPRWEGDHQAIVANRCALLEEAFTNDNGYTVTRAVEHGLAFGYLKEDIRPCVGVYTVKEQRYPVGDYVAQAKAAGVEVAPYILEQCLDDPAYVRALPL